MGFRLVIALVMVPFLLQKLGKDGYGLLGLMGAIFSFSALADMGLRQALGRELSEKVANQDEQGFRVLSSTALALYLGIATGLIIIGWGLAPWLVKIFNVSEALRYDAIWLIRLYGNGSLLLCFITPVFTAGLQSFLRFDAINMVQTVTGILSGLLLFLCLSLVDSSPLLVWAVVSFGILLAELLLQWKLYKKWCFSGKLGLKYLNWRELKPLFRLGGYMCVLQVANALAVQSDPLVVSYFFGTAGVALYQSGAKLSQMLNPIVLTLSNQIQPLTTRFHVLDQQDKQRRTLILGTRYTLLMGVFFSAGIILFAEPFCRLWLYGSLGIDYLTVARVMQLWALANLFIDYAGAMHYPVLVAMKKMPFTLAVTVITSVFNVIVSIYLVGFTRWGIPGAIVATIIAGLVRRPIVIWYVSRITRLPVREYVKVAYMPPAVMFILLLVFYFVLKLFSIRNWTALAVSAGLFGGYAALILSMIERRLLVGIFQQWRQKLIEI